MFSYIYIMYINERRIFMSNSNIRIEHGKPMKDFIADISGRLISEKGISGVTYDDIAKAAGCSRTTVYAYFPCKDDIINYIALCAFRHISNIMQKVIKQPVRADEQLRLLSYELISLCDEKPFYYKCMLEHIDASPEGRKKNPILDEIYNLGEQLNKDFAQIIYLGVSQGIFRDDLKVKPAGLILWSFLATLISLLMNKRDYIESEMLSSQEFLDYGFWLLLRIVMK